MKKAYANRLWQWLLLLLLLAILGASLFFLVRNFEYLRLNGYIHPQHRRYASPAPQDLHGWMTFRYVNAVFGLPANYLQARLDITDGHYPNLTLDETARSQKVSSQELLQRTSAAISAYATQAP
ncbi:MAG TPA: hypothetical protein VHA30_03025 [Patescibacteria group bacterium]|nr:hypothetical protein [Patescibacteria group bacterium]